MLRKLEKYEILEEIGHGGMATVYRARDTKLDRLVALKIMHPHLRGAKEARARFRREAQSVARLKHPRVLEIYDYSGEESEESYIAAELLTGPTLKKFADDHPDMPAEIAACFAIEVARALGAAHGKGIVHRDVKPENILLHADRELKLTDFGIADMVDSQSMTATGQILGSPGHMAPEQIEGGHSDVRTDVFALGTVLYFLATGRLPFTGRNPHQVLKRIVDGDYADPLRVKPAIGAHLRAIIVRALANAPADRYATAADMERELCAFVGAIGIDDPTATLAAYLGDPVSTAADLRTRAITASLAAGRTAVAQKRVREAHDALGRVLALDDGNAEALALIERLGRRDRARSGAVIGALVAGGALLIALGYTAVSAWSDESETLALPPIASASRDAGATAVDVEAPDELDAGPTLDSGAGAPADSGVATPDTGAPLRVTTVRPPQILAPVDDTPRTVIFDFDPQSVTIQIDGDPPRAYGTQFSQTELAPGTHRFVVAPIAVNGRTCCVPADFRMEIPPGPGQTAISRVLESRSAIVFVQTGSVFGEVTIDVAGQRFTGATNEAIDIRLPPGPQRSLDATFTVTARGHAVYTGGRISVTAGQITTERAQLVPLEEPQP